MKRFFQSLFIIALFIVRYGYAQTASKDTTRANTAATINRVNKFGFNNIEISRFVNLLHVDKKESLLLDFSLQKFNLNKISFEKSNPFQPANLNDEQTSIFKKNFANLLSLQYKDSKKYDLGVITEYIGISQTWAAIILAILSVAK